MSVLRLYEIHMHSRTRLDVEVLVVERKGLITNPWFFICPPLRFSVRQNRRIPGRCAVAEENHMTEYTRNKVFPCQLRMLRHCWAPYRRWQHCRKQECAQLCRKEYIFGEVYHSSSATCLVRQESSHSILRKRAQKQIYGCR